MNRVYLWFLLSSVSAAACAQSPLALTVHLVAGDKVEFSGTVPNTYTIVRICLFPAEPDAAAKAKAQPTCHDLSAQPQMGYFHSAAIARGVNTFAIAFQDHLASAAISISGTTHDALKPPPQQDFTIAANQPYCDVSLPYEYTSDPKEVNIKALVKPNWADYLNGLYTAAEIAANGPGNKATNPFTETPFPLTNFSVSDSPNVNTKSRITFDDAGFPLLTQSALAFDPNTFGVQRLLVRTLFGPSPFPVACAFPYLNADAPPAQGQPLHDIDGKLVDALGKGASFHFSLKNPKAPQYYLINVVQWKDSPAPDGAQAPTAAFYAPDTDKWYLLNYSGDPRVSSDLAHLKPITPQLMTETLRILANKSVLLLGIQLAPVPRNAPSAPVPLTEQAWFNNIKVSYTIHADKAQSAEMQDLNALVNVLLSYVGIADSTLSIEGMQQDVAAASATVGGPSIKLSETAIKRLAPITEKVMALNRLVAKVNADLYNAYFSTNSSGERRQNITALEMTLRGAPVLQVARIYGATKQTAQPQALLSVEYHTSGPAVVNEGNLLPVQMPAKAGATPTLDPVYRSFNPLEAAMQPQDPTKAQTTEAQVKAIQDAAVASLQADIDALTAFDAAIDGPLVYSTYQGVYAAGLIDNLTSIPVHLTPSWTATFAATKVAPPAPAPAAPATPATTTPASPAPATQGTRPHGPSAETGDDLLFLPHQQTEQQTTTIITTVPPAGKTPPAAKSAAQTGGANLKSQGKPAAAADPAAAPTAAANPATPTKCTVTLADDKVSQKPCSQSGAVIDDEGRSWWDISLGVSVTGYKDLNIQAAATGSGSTVGTTTTVTRENVYGIFDMFLIPEDLVQPPTLGFPHLIVALPFSGKVFDKPYFAVGETINIPKIAKAAKLSHVPVIGIFASDNFPFQLHPTFGYVWNKESRTNAAGAKYSARSFRPQWTIEIPFRNLTDTIKKAISKK